MHGERESTCSSITSIENEPELVLNLLTHGPIERGLNVTNGGVDHYNMCVDGAGLANVADSFAATPVPR